MFYRLLVAFVFASLLIAIGPASAADVKIGIGTDITGANASMGMQLRNGAEQAIEDVNAKGGILGEKVTSMIGDDRSDPKEAISVAQKFISSDVKFVIGHLTSGASIPTSKEYADAGVLMIAPSATNPVFTERGLWNTVRTAGRDDQQAQVLGDYIFANFKDKKIAIINDKGAYGKGLVDDTRKVLNTGGVTAILDDSITAGEKDFSALISKLKNMNVDVLFYGGYYAEAGLILRQMRDQGLVSTVMIGGDGLYNNELGQIAGDSVVGTLMSYYADPQKNPAAKSVVDTFKAKNIEPSGFTLTSYAAVQLISQAAEEAKSVDPKKVSEAIRSGKTYETVLGPLSYDSKGDMAKSNFVIYEWKKDPSGKLVYTEKTSVSQ